MGAGGKVVPVLLSSEAMLATTHDLVMLDLDGVVYVGSHAVPGAAGHIGAARTAGARVAFITNNASRSPHTVAEHLTDLGVAASAADVVTSAQAAARLVAQEHGAGAAVVCLGADGLREALRAEGLEPVGVHAPAVAVVSGYGPDLVWRDIMTAAVRIRAGLAWFATNTDLTVPLPEGLAPGHGALVGLLSRFAEIQPVVAGKPARPLLDETIRRVGGERPLMVGDRLDTDIEGARVRGVDSLLVLTGVTGLPELVSAPPGQRPTYLAADLGGLLEAHRAPTSTGSGWELEGWRARVEGGRLLVDRIGADGHTDDAWRVAAAAAWEHLDRCGRVVDVSAAGLPEPQVPSR